MNTLLMSAYEALNVLYVKAQAKEDPQTDRLAEIMDILWRNMDQDEINILNSRYAK